MEKQVKGARALEVLGDLFGLTGVSFLDTVEIKSK
jgi:hypothetical protein